MHSDAHRPIVPKRPLVLSECEIVEAVVHSGDGVWEVRPCWNERQMQRLCSDPARCVCAEGKLKKRDVQGLMHVGVPCS